MNPATRPPGRPTKFNEETTTRLITALRSGNYRRVSCKYAGIHYNTLLAWLAKAEEPDAPPEYLEFSDAVEKAEAEAEIHDIALIRQAATGGQWQAAAWIRERKNPERWGRRDASKIELTGADGGPVDMRVSLGVDVSAIESLVAKLESRSRVIEADSIELE